MIKDLLDDYWMKQKCFEVSGATSRKSNTFKKDQVTLKKTTQENDAKIGTAKNGFGPPTISRGEVMS